MNLDVTVYNAGGYHGDLNETFCVGNVDDDGRRVVKTSFECLQSALELVKPGALYRDLGNTIEKVAKKNRCVAYGLKDRLVLIVAGRLHNSIFLASICLRQM